MSAIMAILPFIDSIYVLLIFIHALPQKQNHMIELIKGIDCCTVPV